MSPDARAPCMASTNGLAGDVEHHEDCRIANARHGLPGDPQERYAPSLDGKNRRVLIGRSIRAHCWWVQV